MPEKQVFCHLGCVLTGEEYIIIGYTNIIRMILCDVISGGSVWISLVPFPSSRESSSLDLFAAK